MEISVYLGIAFAVYVAICMAEPEEKMIIPYAIMGAFWPIFLIVLFVGVAGKISIEIGKKWRQG